MRTEDRDQEQYINDIMERNAYVLRMLAEAMDSEYQAYEEQRAHEEYLNELSWDNPSR